MNVKCFLCKLYKKDSNNQIQKTSESLISLAKISVGEKKVRKTERDTWKKGD